MKIRPLHNYVLLRRLEAESQTAGGLFIPENAKEAPLQGKVVAVGRGKLLPNGEMRTLDVQEGDRVLFGKYSGKEIRVDGEPFLMMKEDEILAVLS